MKLRIFILVGMLLCLSGSVALGSSIARTKPQHTQGACKHSPKHRCVVKRKHKVVPKAAYDVNIVGDSTTECCDDSNGAGQAQAWQYTATQTATATEISVFINSGSSTSTVWHLGIYADASGHPGALLYQLASNNPALNRWVTFVGPSGGPTITAGKKYWLAILGTGGTPHWPDKGAGGTACPSYMSSSTSLTTLPNSWSGTSSVPSCPASLYVNGTTGTPPPPPSPPSNTAVPTVSGTTQQGSTLTTTNGTWTNSPTSYGYKWQDCDTAGANCTNITGAASSSYTLVAADVGHTVRSVVTATNAGGSGSASSAQTAVVTTPPPPSPPSNTTAPAVTGATTVGSALSTSNGSWTNSPTSFAYQWQSCSPTCANVGTNANQYTTVASDQGHTVKVIVTATNAGGSGNATSNSVGPITAAASVVYRVHAGGPAYTDTGGNVWQADAFNDGGGGNQTSSTTATITNTNDPALYQTERWGDPGFTYTFPNLTAGASYAVTLKFAEIYYNASGQRKFNVAINGTAVLTNFDIVADAGAANKADDKTFTTTANSSGQVVIAFTNASPVVDNPKVSAIQVATAGGGGGSTPPSNTAVPTVSGTPQQGQTLTTTNGTWSGTAPITYAYQWQDCLSGTCSNISGATNSTYVLQASDVGDTVRSVVTGTNSAGSASANSAQTAVVTAVSNGIGQCTQGAPGNTVTYGSQAYNLAGMDTFTKNAAVGSFASADGTTPVYTGDHGMQWTEYADGWTATYTGGKVGYQPSTVQSVHDGVLDWNLHTSTVNGANGPVAANPSPLPAGNRYQTYGAYSFCEKIVPNAGSNLGDYYQANLLWPQNDADWQKAESDYPEGNLNNTSFESFSHYGGAGAQDNFNTGTIDPSQWHVYTQTWGPGFRSYYVDGRLIGTSTNQVWSSPERWQLQIEPSGTTNGGSGHLYMNWVWVGTPAGSTPPAPTNTTQPVISGTPKQGSTLTVSNGSWTNSPTSFAYQWQSCSTTCTNVGTNSNTYVPTAGDVGNTVDAIVTATNAGGSGSSQASAVGPVTANTTTGIQHVVWVWMENHGYSQVINAPYISSLASTYGSATNYFALDHPSLPNYIEATSGGAQGVSDDADPSSHPLSAQSIFSQLPGGQSRSLMGAMPSNCFKSDSGSGPDYVAHHNPMAYYTNLGTDCSNFNVPLGSTPDISAKFTFIAPDECSNMHDCSVATGDSYLQSLIPAIQARPEYQAGNTAIFVVWDEDGSTTGGPQENNHVASLVISPFTHGVSDATSFDHYSLLKTAEQLLGLPQLGAAASANSMVGRFGF